MKRQKEILIAVAFFAAIYLIAYFAFGDHGVAFTLTTWLLIRGLILFGLFELFQFVKRKLNAKFNLNKTVYVPIKSDGKEWEKL